MTDQTATDQRIEGTREKTVGKARAALGRLTGDRKQQVEGHLTEYKGKARDAYGRVIDGLDGLGLDAEPTDPQRNFSFCLATEFPAAAVLIKAHWIRADFGRPVSVYDTDAESLRAVIADGRS